MNNPITKALSDLSFKIPHEVLRVAFQDNGPNWRQAPISLDQQIMTKVIKQRVLVDVDLLGGQTIIVNLIGIAPKWMDNHSIVYEIPAEMLLHRSIISVLSVGYLPYTTTYGNQGIGSGTTFTQGINDVTSAAQRVSASFSNVPIVSNAQVELVGYNTVLIREQTRVTNSYQLRCVVANEENLANLNPRSFLSFSKLVELAVKSYIYNSLLIKIDQAYLQGGQELGAMKQYVDGLADSEQMYQDFLREVWQNVSFHMDPMAHTRFIKLMVNPGV